MKNIILILFIVFSYVNPAIAFDGVTGKLIGVNETGGIGVGFSVPEDWELISVVPVVTHPTKRPPLNDEYNMFFQDKSGRVFIAPLKYNGSFWTITQRDIYGTE